MKKLCNSLFNFLKKLLIKYVNRKYKYNVEGLIKLLHLLKQFIYYFRLLIINF